MTLDPGSRLGPYEITAQIGAGGMGVVYRATDTTLGRQVAIKVLPESMAGDGDRLARFDREARTLAALNHPHVAAIYGLERSADATALVMELVEGPTLADRIATGAIPVDEALPIARQIAEALEAAHDQGIIHRDLKPANIKLRPDGVVKVLDFGLAKTLEPQGPTAASVSMSPTITTPAMTAMGVILGTAAYMSPEQARGRAADRRSDIWSFGCVLYEMLTGRRAFRGEDVSETLADVLRGEPAWDGLPPDLSPSTTAFLKRCLQKDVRQRLGDIRDMRLALEGAFAVAGQPALAIPATRSWWRTALVPLAAVLAVGVSAGVAWMLRPDVPRRVSRATQLLAEGQVFRNTGRHAVSMAPDGRAFLYNSTSGVYFREMNALEARVIPGTEASITSPTLSPDGESVAFWDSDRRELRRVWRNGGAALTLTPAANPFGVSWEEDGTILYGQDDGIWEVSDRGGTARRIISTVAGEQAHGPDRLPGSQWIVFTLTRTQGAERWDKAEIVAHFASSGERRVLLKEGSDARYVSTGLLLYAHRSTLFAVAFDRDRVEVTGIPVPVVEGVRRVLNPQNQTGAAQYSVSNDGTLVYLPGAAAEGQFTLALVDAAGRVEQMQTMPGDYAAPRASPDGKRVAVEVAAARGSGDRHVFVIERETGVATQLTFDGTINQSPVWTQDGRAIVFVSDRARNGKWAFYRKAADGTGTTDLILESAGGIRAYDISRDGVLVFGQTAADGSNVDLMTMPLSGAGKPVVFLATRRSETWARFSPDGRLIAYVADQEGGTQQVYVRPYPVNGDAQWRVSDDFGANPLWAADQSALLLIRGTDQLSAPVGMRPAFTRGALRRLFSWTTVPERAGSQRDLVPGDGRFLFVSAGDDFQASIERRELVTVINWFEELRAKVKPSP